VQLGQHVVTDEVHVEDVWGAGVNLNNTAHKGSRAPGGAGGLTSRSGGSVVLCCARKLPFGPFKASSTRRAKACRKWEHLQVLYP